MKEFLARAAEERRDLADFLETLTPTQWHHPSLCEDWSVRDVVAHVVSYEELGPVGLVGRFARGGLLPDRVNRVGVREYAARSPEQLVALLRSHAVPRGLTAGLGGGIGLADAVIHHQDLRRPLGAPREVPGDRLLPTLRLALGAPTLPSRRKVRGLRLEATDHDWAHGDGPLVTGPAEALLMAIAGRRPALDDLAGDGLPVLRERLAA